ncbi:MAG: gluconate 2-dehydrogenase subunit 3 family protein [Cyclobacteriaceae bacterium]
MERREALKKSVIAAGSAAMMPSLLSLLQSCKQQVRLDWQPVFLNEQHARLISTLVDVILPKTATPGGLEMKVDIFIDLIFSKLYDKEGQQMVVDELNKFDVNCQQKFGDSFVELSTENRNAILKEAEANSGKFNKGVWGTAVGEQKPVGFYRSLKSTILWGYFTSEEIGEKVLNYDPIPGDYLGCIPLSDVGNSWSL